MEQRDRRMVTDRRFTDIGVRSDPQHLVVSMFKQMLAISIAAALTACAAQPDTKVDAATPAQTSKPDSAEKTKMSDAEKLVAMQKAGYTLVNQDGQILYCRTDRKTGTRIARDTVCLTEKEAEELRETTQRRLGEMMRQTPPPQGK